MDDTTSINQRIEALDPDGLIPLEITSGYVYSIGLHSYAQEKIDVFNQTHDGDCGVTVAEIEQYVQHLINAIIKEIRKEEEHWARAHRSFLQKIRQHHWDAYLECLPLEKAYDEWVLYRQRYENATPEDREEMHLP